MKTLALTQKKTRKITILMLVTAVIFLLSSCNGTDYRMFTQINRDGSCTRVFSENADSAFMTGDTASSQPFPFQPDSSWKISWQYLTPEIHENWPLDKWEWEKGEKK